MNADLMEQLLNEQEGEALDFKRDQYRFVGASDGEKSELLKDILAFTNSWRRTDAYILIGVEEVKGGRSIVRGISQSLDDASLQQFVNQKTQRPINFSYREFPFEGVTTGIIQIPLQTRPIYLETDFGRVKRRVVYLRRGSSTDEASPEEISRMGAAAISTPAANPKRVRLEEAMKSNESVVVLYWAFGRGDVTMRSVHPSCKVVEVNENYASFQPEVGPPISGAYEQIILTRNPSGQLKVDIG